DGPEIDGVVIGIAVNRHGGRGGVDRHSVVASATAEGEGGGVAVGRNGIAPGVTVDRGADGGTIDGDGVRAVATIEGQRFDAGVVHHLGAAADAGTGDGERVGTGGAVDGEIVGGAGGVGDGDGAVRAGVEV